MTDNLFGAEESELYSVSINDTICAQNIKFGRGDIISGAHDCPNPEHKKGQVIPILTIVITDVDGKVHHVVLPSNSPAAHYLADDDFKYTVRRLLGLDN